MTKEQMIEVVKKSIEVKHDKLKFAVELDAEKIVKEILFVVCEDFAKDTENPYDDKLVEMMKKFIEAKLA